MNFKRLISVVLATMLVITCVPITFASTEPNSPETEEATLSANEPYKDTSLSFEERAADLVSRMTLQEKVAQIRANSADAISRLGVSSYNYWKEGLHGVARQGSATNFPTSLSMSNTWDLDLAYRAADITSTEARGKNNKTNLSYWSPTINMARDPRWGRNEESYGEDPHLTGQIGMQFVDGMQGSDETYLKTIATTKHFAANNCEGERQTGSSSMTESTFRDYYTRAFKDVVEVSDNASIMSSYNALTLTRDGEMFSDYIASSANKYLLTDLLRRTWGFSGYVVGDCGAFGNVAGRSQLRQKLFPDLPLSDIPSQMAYAKIIQAGGDLDCGGGSLGTNGVGGLYDSVMQGYLDENELDVAVYRMFLQRMRTGEFGGSGTNPYANIQSSVIEQPGHTDVALEAAEKSWVLLENDGILPLEQNTGNVAVVGNLAEKLIVGDYSADSSKQTVTPLQGLKNEFGENAVHYLGQIDSSTPLFNIKSINLVLENGNTRAVDLSTATNVAGMTKSGSELKNITKPGVAMIPNIDFSSVKEVEVEASSASSTAPSAILNFGYNSHNQGVATVAIESTDSSSTYKINVADYLGARGGYDKTANLYLSVNANSDFDVNNYKTQLDAADVIIAYAGTTTADSSESHDRSNIYLPDTQSHVYSLCEAYPEKTVVVMSTVGQIDVSRFKDKCAAMLWTSYNGQLQGTALANVLTGKVNPAGKLTTTWYAAPDLEKMPIGSPGETIDGVKYNVTDYEIKQRDGYPGRTYQYYSGTPDYPFGFGLSYTSFDYSDISVSSTNADANDTIKVTAKIKNTGSTKGAEVVQLYVSVPGADGKTYPLKQLKGFERVELNPSEEKTVEFDLDISDIYFFNEKTQANYIVNGEYTIMVGQHSDNGITTTLNVTGDLAKTLKNVQAVPSGLKIYGGIAGGDSTSTPAHGVDADISAVLIDDSFIAQPRR